MGIAKGGIDSRQHFMRPWKITFSCYSVDTRGGSSLILVSVALISKSSMFISILVGTCNDNVHEIGKEMKDLTTPVKRWQV